MKAKRKTCKGNLVANYTRDGVEAVCTLCGWKATGNSPAKVSNEFLKDHLPDTPQEKHKKKIRQAKEKRLDAISPLIEAGYSLPFIAKILKISKSTAERWKKEYLESLTEKEL